MLSKSIILPAQPWGMHCFSCSYNHRFGKVYGLQDIPNPSTLFKLTDAWICGWRKKNIPDPQNIISLVNYEKRDAFVCESPAARASPQCHSPLSSDIQYPHLKGPLFSLMLQGCLQLGMLQETCNASTLHVLCPSFLKDIPIAKTRMNGLLLPNLDVHLSLQAPSKGCSKNPKKRWSPISRFFLPPCFIGGLKRAV